MLTKTIKLKILADDKQTQRFKGLTEAYRRACNFVSDYVFEHSFPLSSMALQKALYRTVREKFGLNSTMTCSVFRTVVARCKTVREQMKQKPYRYKDSDGKYKSIPPHPRMARKAHRVPPPAGRLRAGRQLQLRRWGSARR